LQDIETEMRVVTFTKLLENGEECPEMMKPFGQDGTAYMKKFIENAKNAGAPKYPKFYTERHEKKSEVEIEVLTSDEVPDLE